MENIQLIAENYVNGNHVFVSKVFLKMFKWQAIKAAFDVYEFLRLNNGQKTANNFSVWLRT